MRYLIIITLLAAVACAPAPTDLPEDFDASFAF